MSYFSRRHDPVPDTYRYSIREQVRSRLLHTIRLCLDAQGSNNISISTVFEEMRDKLLQRYGDFRRPAHEAARVSNDPVVEHFFRCTDEEVMDFLEMCFETRWNFGRQQMVEALNRVLDEENTGFELSPYSETVSDGATLFGRYSRTAKTVHPHLPKAIRKDEQILHAESVKPCFDALSDPRFATANSELLNAFEEHRRGKHGNAVTDAGSALESVLKIICAHKGWPYDKNRDTCATLLDICRKNGLFPPFYKQVLEGCATIRNKIGDAHGQGPTPEFPATKALAGHMLYSVCNNINLLVSLAAL